jgi:hypothetical protein
MGKNNASIPQEINIVKNEVKERNKEISKNNQKESKKEIIQKEELSKNAINPREPINKCASEKKEESSKDLGTETFPGKEDLKVPSRKNIYWKGKSITFQNNKNGIMQDFKNSETNLIVLSCSGTYGNESYRQVGNILDYDDSNWWFSKNEPNSWICIKFNSKRILLSRYFFRSGGMSGICNPKSWKLLVSNDDVTWIQVDEQINRDWVAKDFTEVYFPVETIESFSHFKFIQTGKNYFNDNRFLLCYVEFFGTIFSG